MDHSHMDHSHMDHGDMGHGGMDHGHMCSMNMLFTWDTTDLCLVFRSWHVRNTWTLIVALIGVVILTAGYELVRELTRQYEAKVNKRLEALPIADESSSLLRPGTTRAGAERSAKLGKSVLYGIQVFYSFFIMLLFMTYNGWVMLAVGVGAFVGFLLFAPAGASGQKDVACH